MVVFPSIVKRLGGNFFIQLDNAMDGTLTNVNQVKLGFKMPFELADTDNITAQHYKLLNSSNMTSDGKAQLYRMTPQIKSKSNLVVSDKDLQKMRQQMPGVLSVNSSKIAVSKKDGNVTSDTHSLGNFNINSKPKNLDLKNEYSSQIVQKNEKLNLTKDYSTEEKKVNSNRDVSTSEKQTQQKQMERAQQLNNAETSSIDKSVNMSMLNSSLLEKASNRDNYSSKQKLASKNIKFT